MFVRTILFILDLQERRKEYTTTAKLYESRDEIRNAFVIAVAKADGLSDPRLADFGGNFAVRVITADKGKPHAASSSSKTGAKIDEESAKMVTVDEANSVHYRFQQSPLSKIGIRIAEKGVLHAETFILKEFDGKFVILG